MHDRQRLFVVKYVPCRSDFLATITAEEGAQIEAHFAYLLNFHDRGVLQFAGRCEDASFGIAIFAADSLQAAQGLVDDDPAVRSQVFTADVHEFKIALGSFA